MRIQRAVVCAFVCLLPAAVSAQGERPFVFSVATSTDPSTHVTAHYDVGVGDASFHQQESNGPEQRIGIQATIGRFTVIGRAGVAAGGASYQTSQQGEVLFSLFNQGDSPLGVAVGGGILHEAGGAEVALARIVAGRDTATSRAHANVLFEKPLVTDRDAVDVITSLGWLAKLTPAFALGVEAVGEDLEGFWNAAEAEGGARLLVGPSVHVGPPGRKWELGVAGGPLFRATTSPRASDALRDLPAATTSRGYAARATFACRF